MILVRITMTARPEKRQEVVQTLLPMIEPTLQEKGCLKYQIFQDIEDKNSFTLVEEWATRENLDAHMRTDKFDVLCGAKILLTKQQHFQIHTISRSEGIEAVYAVKGKRI